mmetsp:Transcript_12525/g.20276  ORF Transcript_12525/g.20276 Transcript_12525/m.20276 type:complete len:158 (+) Transcript_12525:161-634(+)
MASLLLWPPRIPHTQYVLHVNASGSAPFLVVKRYNDFKTLHMRAEQDGVRLAVGASLELPGSLGSLGGLDSFAPFGSDPGVVALRRVGLQRYLDLLACSGCPYAIAHLRVFLELDATSESSRIHGGGRKQARGGCGGCGLSSAVGLDCAEFLGVFGR